MANQQDRATSENELRLRAVIETAIDGIITIDDRGHIETINQAARELFGYSADEVVGQNVSILMPQPHRSQHDEYLSRYQHTRQAHIIGIGREVEGRRKDGSLFPLRLAVSEVRLPDRVIYTGILHDLSAVKAAERKLEELNAGLENLVDQRTHALNETIEALSATNQRLGREIEERLQVEARLRKALRKEKELVELKSRFVSLVSHEFRTPLTTVLSSAELIAAYDQTAQQDKRLKHVGRIRQSVQALTEILNDLLSLSKLEEGRVQAQIEAIVPAKLVKRIEELMQASLGPAQKLSIRLIEEAELYTDNRLLRQIIVNLLSNAIKYSHADGAIEATFHITTTQLHLQVKDWGIGIPKADQKFLFTRFFRARNAENIQGNGLGLSLVKHYVEILQGQLAFTSEEGRGTTFAVNLPNRLPSE